MLTSQVILDSKVRECDLLQSQMLLKDAKECWAAAQEMFPANILVLNELGNVLSQVGIFLLYVVLLYCKLFFGVVPVAVLRDESYARFRNRICFAT